MTTANLDTRRIDHLLSPDRLRNVRVTIAGLGSGGAPVVQQLTQSGVRDWELFDGDVMDDVNLVKHPARRVDIGRPKVEITREWILDRNPAARVATHQCDVRGNAAFEHAVRTSDLVLCAVDNRASREYISDLCVRHHVPCVMGMVFRGGFGGNVYTYVPGATGCLRCLDTFSEANELALDDQAGLANEERERIYGLDDKNFQLSGLVSDINMIATLHAQQALSLLVGAPGTPVPPATFNWLVFGNRPHPGGFSGRYQSRKLRLAPQSGCLGHCGSSALDAPQTPLATLLGVSPASSSSELRNAYHELVARVHPDRVAPLSSVLQAVAHERTIRLRAAYDGLREAA